MEDGGARAWKMEGRDTGGYGAVEGHDTGGWTGVDGAAPRQSAPSVPNLAF